MAIKKLTKDTKTNGKLRKGPRNKLKDVNEDSNVYIHIAKCAGQAVSAGLKNAGCVLENTPSYHCTYAQLLEVNENVSVARRAAFVRNPYARFQSAFHFLNKQKNKIDANFISNGAKTTGIGMGSMNSILSNNFGSFEEFVLRFDELTSRQDLFISTVENVNSQLQDRFANKENCDITQLSELLASSLEIFNGTEKAIKSLLKQGFDEADKTQTRDDYWYHSSKFDNVIKNSVFFLPQHLYLENNEGEIDIDFIGKVENMAEDFPKLVEYFGGDESTEIKKLNSSKHDPWKDVYSQEMRDIVYSHYQKDFEIFGYEP